MPYILDRANPDEIFEIALEIFTLRSRGLEDTDRFREIATPENLLIIAESIDVDMDF